MNLGQIAQVLIGTIVGGVFVIIGGWIARQAEKRGEAQKSYKQMYIDEGIEPLITYLISLELRIRNKAAQNPMRLIDIDTVPVVALARIQTLVKAGLSVAKIITLLSEYLNDEVPNEDQIALQHLASICDALLAFRKDCLKDIATKMDSEHDQVSDKHAADLSDELDEILNGLVKERIKRSPALPRISQAKTLLTDYYNQESGLAGLFQLTQINIVGVVDKQGSAIKVAAECVSEFIIRQPYEYPAKRSEVYTFHLQHDGKQWSVAGMSRPKVQP